MELASLVSRSKKPVKVYPVPILLEVNSLLASYTIPGMRVEGTTYDVPTFSALKGAGQSDGVRYRRLQQGNAVNQKI